VEGAIGVLLLSREVKEWSGDWINDSQRDEHRRLQRASGQPLFAISVCGMSPKRYGMI
jgi:hypothetical protein